MKYKINMQQAARLLGKNEVWLRQMAENEKLPWAIGARDDTAIYYVYPKIFIEMTGVTCRQVSEITGIDWTEFYTENFQRPKLCS